MKQYFCECGKIFDNPQKFNGHKRHCKDHAAAVNKVEILRQADVRAAETGRTKGRSKVEARVQKKLIEDETKLNIWIQEKHECERCGVIMTTKFASGRFCSVTCAHARPQSDMTKQNISVGVRATNKAKPIDSHKRQQNITLYNLSPRHCAICNKALEYDKRNNKTCGEPSCVSKQISVACSRSNGKQVKGKHVDGTHIVYKVINDFDSRYYIGVRKTDDTVFDGYLGNSQWTHIP